MTRIFKDIRVKHPAQYRSAVCLICGLSLILSGCQSRTQTVSPVPQIIDRIKPIEKIQAKTLTTQQQIDKLDAIDGILAQKDTAVTPDAFIQAKSAIDSISLSELEPQHYTTEISDI